MKMAKEAAAAQKKAEEEAAVKQKAAEGASNAETGEATTTPKLLMQISPGFTSMATIAMICLFVGSRVAFAMLRFRRSTFAVCERPLLG